jgi:hypothetical protein
MFFNFLMSNYYDNGLEIKNYARYINIIPKNNIEQPGSKILNNRN